MLLIQVLLVCAGATAAYGLYALAAQLTGRLAAWRAARRKKNAEWDQMMAELDAKEAAKKSYTSLKKGAKKPGSQKNRHRSNKGNTYTEDPEPEPEPEPVPVKPSGPARAVPDWMREEEHELLVAQLKGFKNPVLSVSCSADGQRLASCSRDKCILLHPQQKLARKPGADRINITGDYAIHVQVSSRMVAAVMNDSRNVRVMSFTGEQLCEFEPGHLPTQPLARMILTDSALGWDPAAHAMSRMDALTVLTFDRKTLFRVHGLGWAGKELMHRQLAAVDTKKVVNYDVAISRHARYVAVANFTDCKLWEIERTAPSGEVKAVSSSLVLGTKAVSCALEPMATRLALASAQGQISMCARLVARRLTAARWRIDVDHKRGERPIELWQSEPVLADRQIEQLLWSPDGGTLAVCDTNTIVFVSCENGSVAGQAVRGAHGPLVHGSREDAPMASVSWLADSSGLVSGGSDKMLRLWRNPIHRP